MSKIAKSIVATQRVASSSRNKNVDAEREGTVNKVTRSAPGTMSDKSMLHLPLSSLQRLIEEHVVLDFLPSLYAEMLCQLAEAYSRFPRI